MFVAILVVGLVIRFALAPYSSGSDIPQFAGFAKTFHRHGFCFYRYAAAYISENWPFNWPYIYGPILMYLLGVLGHLIPPTYTTVWQGGLYRVYVSTSWVFANKLLYIAFDAIVATAIYLITRRIYTAILFYLNPATIYISSVYGMFDQIVAGIMIVGIYALSRKRYLISGATMGLALMMKQTVLFPIAGLIISLLLHREFRSFTRVVMGLALGVLVLLLPILIHCPNSLQGVLDGLYMIRPRYAEPIMYNFNGVTGVATLIHRFGMCVEACRYEVLWPIEHWYIFTAILLPLTIAYTLAVENPYRLSALYYILFTATYWNINYQYLIPEIALIAIASTLEKDRLLKILYITTAVYIALWVFIYPVEWWFKLHIENPNTVLTGIMRSLSLNIYCDNVYAIYSLLLTQLHYTIILRAAVPSIEIYTSKLIRFLRSRTSIPSY